MKVTVGYGNRHRNKERIRMIKQLLDSDAATFETSLKALFANILFGNKLSKQLHIKREAYCSVTVSTVSMSVGPA